MNPSPRRLTTVCTMGSLLERMRRGTLTGAPFARRCSWSDKRICAMLQTLYWGLPPGCFAVQRSGPENGVAPSACEPLMLIDGMQRLTILSSVLYRIPVDKNDGQRLRLQIAFQPQTGEFARAASTMSRGRAWLPDMAVLFDDGICLETLTQAYCAVNKTCARQQVGEALSRLQAIVEREVALSVMHQDFGLAEMGTMFERLNMAPNQRSRPGGLPHAVANFICGQV